MKKQFRVAASMPELRHSIKGEPFSIGRSQVARWLCSRPEIMQAVFDICRENSLIRYDPESGTWSGTGEELA